MESHDIVELEQIYAHLDGAYAAQPEPLSEEVLRNYPLQIFIGYFPSKSKRDIQDVIKSIVSRNTQSAASFYQIKRWHDGYLYEVHDGGPGFGCLSSILNFWDANNGDAVILPTSDIKRKIKIIQSSGSVSSLFLTEGDASVFTPDILFTDKLIPANNDGSLLLKSAAAFLFAGITAFSSALAVKILVTQDYAYEPVALANIELPRSQIDTIKKYSIDSEAYLHKVEFTGGVWHYINQPRESNGN